MNIIQPASNTLIYVRGSIAARRAQLRLSIRVSAQRPCHLPWRRGHGRFANTVIAQLLHLESADPDKDISLYINSPGGSVSAGLAIYDTMQYIKPDVSTICIGMAGFHGRRPAGPPRRSRQALPQLPNSTIMIHQPSGGAQGKEPTSDHGRVHAQDA